MIKIASSHSLFVARWLHFRTNQCIVTCLNTQQQTTHMQMKCKTNTMAWQQVIVSQMKEMHNLYGVRKHSQQCLYYTVGLFTETYYPIVIITASSIARNFTLTSCTQWLRVTFDIVWQIELHQASTTFQSSRCLCCGWLQWFLASCTVLMRLWQGVHSYSTCSSLIMWRWSATAALSPR